MVLLAGLEMSSTIQTCTGTCACTWHICICPLLCNRPMAAPMGLLRLMSPLETARSEPCLLFPALPPPGPLSPCAHPPSFPHRVAGQCGWVRTSPCTNLKGSISMPNPIQFYKCYCSCACNITCGGEAVSEASLRYGNISLLILGLNCGCTSAGRLDRIGNLAFSG